MLRKPEVADQNERGLWDENNNNNNDYRFRKVPFLKCFSRARKREAMFLLNSFSFSVDGRSAVKIKLLFHISPAQFGRRHNSIISLFGILCAE